MNYEEREERLIHKLSMKKIQDELNEDEIDDGPFTHNERLMRGLFLVYDNEYVIYENKINNKKSNRTINESLENCMIVLNLMLKINNDPEWVEIIEDEIDRIRLEMNVRKKISLSQIHVNNDIMKLIVLNI